MSDLRTRLDRIGDRAHPAPDAFARFEGTRRRRERTRRVTAGVVAFVVAAAGSVGVFSLLGDDGENVLGGGEAEFLALWPEPTLDAALAANDAVETGDPALQWRLDPDATAARFASEALGWQSEDFTTALVGDAQALGSGSVTVRLRTPVDCDDDGAALCGVTEVQVTLDQLVGPEAVWSVVGVRTRHPEMEIRTGNEVDIGTEISVAAGFEDGTDVAVGFAGTGSCSAFHEETVQVMGLAVAAVVPDALAGCTGYVYALTPSTPRGQIELGRIMFPCCGMNEKPDLGYTIQAIAAVPVTFVDPAGTSIEPAQVGQIACDGADPIVQTPVVATQPDGVHVEISNPTDQTISFSIGPDVASPDAAVSPLAPGTVDLVLTDAPGTMSFACSPPPEEGQAGVSGLGSFEVVDPAGNYVPADLECDTGSAYGGGAAQPGSPVGEQGDPIDIARRRLTGLDPGDVVEAAGYSGAPSPILRIVRDGKVLGKVTLTEDAQGGWLPGSVEGCGGTSFGWNANEMDFDAPVDLSRCPAPSAAPELVAINIDFEPTCLVVSAGERLTITMHNQDAGVPRNLAIYPLTNCLAEALETANLIPCNGHLDGPLFVGEIVYGPATIVYEIGALEPGRYYLQDEVHPGANGVLLVQ